MLSSWEQIYILENVEHCEGEPEQADTGILCHWWGRAWASWYRGIFICHWWVDEWCNIFKIQCSVQVDTMVPSLSNSKPMDLLNVTDSSSPCTSHLSSLACLTSVHSDCLPSCSLWHQHYSLAVALSSRSRCNLSLALSRFIGVELLHHPTLTLATTVYCIIHSSFVNKLYNIYIVFLFLMLQYSRELILLSEKLTHTYKYKPYLSPSCYCWLQKKL